jgi:pilus assembly protein TadC
VAVSPVSMIVFWSALAGALAASTRPRRHRRLTSSHRGKRLGAGGLALAAAASSATVAGVLVGGVGGLMSAVIVAPMAYIATRSVQRRERENEIGPAELRSIALLVDLLATALEAGAPPEHAIALIADAVSATLSAAAPSLGAANDAARPGGSAARSSLARAMVPLDRVGRLLMLGADPATAWSELDGVPGYREAAAAGRRCAASGSRLATSLHQAAAELRVSHRQAALARAERLGVWSLLPLGLCFLPAFVCIGIAPVVIGVAGQALVGTP